ncbi:MAG: histidine kinase [Odoribacteraceae bacterium]|nr:histidine kinase [Odoribacteraceae bacterium]
MITSYLFLMVYFYLNSHVFVPRFLSRKRIALFLGITVVAYILFCLVIPAIFRHYFASGLPFGLGMPPGDPGFQPRGVGRVMPFKIFVDPGLYSRSSQFLVIFMISTGLKAGAQWYAEKRHLQELENAMVQAELSFLKSQIHPHFLFNSLNSIYYLALSKDDKAPEAILSLAGFLRFVTTEGSHNRIPLKKEVKMMEEYIHLQSLRVPEKFELRFQLQGDFREWTIMPLTFVPFVENAFKHGTSARISCFIHVRVEVEEGMLKFTCDNSIAPGINDEHLSAGVGLKNTRKRLELAYPGRHSLTVGADGPVFRVKLQISLA